MNRSDRQAITLFSSLSSLTALIAATAILASCASTPDVGVRSDFEERHIQSVAIAPFYSAGSFGLDADTRAELADEYEAVAAEALRQMGFEVIDGPTLRHHLRDADAWSDFDDGIRLRQALSFYFEPLPGEGSHSIEVQTLTDLASRQAFPVDTLLFGEIVYHSQGTCRVSADDFTPYAQITLIPSAPAELPRPCVSSHFQAKLVDVNTGKTMWFNRMFVETHTRHLDDDTARETIARTINATFSADGGIAPLAPPQLDEAHAESP